MKEVSGCRTIEMILVAMLTHLTEDYSRWVEEMPGATGLEPAASS